MKVGNKKGKIKQNRNWKILNYMKKKYALMYTDFHLIMKNILQKKFALFPLTLQKIIFTSKLKIKWIIISQTLF